MAAALSSCCRIFHDPVCAQRFFVPWRWRGRLGGAWSRSGTPRYPWCLDGEVGRKTQTKAATARNRRALWASRPLFIHNCGIRHCTRFRRYPHGQVIAVAILFHCLLQVSHDNRLRYSNFLAEVKKKKNSRVYQRIIVFTITKQCECV